MRSLSALHFELGPGESSRCKTMYRWCTRIGDEDGDLFGDLIRVGEGVVQNDVYGVVDSGSSQAGERRTRSRYRLNILATR